MIEIIREENWDATQEKNGLPKNIKQIGTPDAGDRIYIENEAYQTMHRYGHCTGKTVYIMLGRYDDFAGHTCVFIENAIEMEEVAFNGSQPVWNDETWGILYRKLRPEHENMIIVGWAIDVYGEFPHMTAQLEHMHQTYFGGVHQILLLMDSIEQEEAFYSNRSGYLKRREGFYIYYDKNIPGRMESAMESLCEGQDREETYREYLNQRNAKRMHRTPQIPQGGSHLPTLLLLAVVVALGYSAFQNYQKMDQMQQALDKMNEMQVILQTESGEEDVIRVEEIAGSVGTAGTEQEVGVNSTAAPETETAATTDAAVASEAAEQTTVTEPGQSSETGHSSETWQETETVKTLSEAQQYLAQGYYVVQKGDSLASICRKIYNTTAMMDKLCEVNGIDDPDAIYAGQYLELPK